MAKRKSAGRSRKPVPPPDNEILTPDEAARVLRVSKRTLLEMARSGKIPAKKLGRQWRFHRRTLRSWIAGDSETQAMIAALTKAGIDVSVK